MRSFDQVEVVCRPNGKVELKVGGKTRMKFGDVARFHQFIEHLIRISGYQNIGRGPANEDSSGRSQPIPKDYSELVIRDFNQMWRSLDQPW